MTNKTNEDFMPTADYSVGTSQESDTIAQQGLIIAHLQECLERLAEENIQLRLKYDDLQKLFIHARSGMHNVGLIVLDLPQASLDDVEDDY